MELNEHEQLMEKIRQAELQGQKTLNIDLLEKEDNKQKEKIRRTYLKAMKKRSRRVGRPPKKKRKFW